MIPFFLTWLFQWCCEYMHDRLRNQNTWIMVWVTGNNKAKLYLKLINTLFVSAGHGITEGSPQGFFSFQLSLFVAVGSRSCLS